MDIQLPKVGDRVRFAIWHANAWRPLGWLRVGKDGSISLAFFPVLRSWLRRRFFHPPSRSSSGIKSSKRLPPTKARRCLCRSKYLERSTSATQYGMERRLVIWIEGRQLCTMIFAHPSRYRPPKKTNRYDFDVKHCRLRSCRRPADVGRPFCRPVHRLTEAAEKRRAWRPPSLLRSVTEDSPVLRTWLSKLSLGTERRDRGQPCLVLWFFND